ncbi:MAG: hypothetical protein ACRD0H_13755, partial [Actinomycetes bacterium]
MMAAASTRRPAEIAADALRAALVRGSAALLDIKSGREPTVPEVCGWERLGGMTLTAEVMWRRVGSPLGWTDGERIWLQPTAATDEINRHARAAGNPLNLTQSGLTQMLADAEVIRTRETKTGRRYTVKVRIGTNRPGPGPQMTVWEVPWSWLFPEDDADPTSDGTELEQQPPPTSHVPEIPEPPSVPPAAAAAAPQAAAAASSAQSASPDAPAPASAASVPTAPPARRTAETVIHAETAIQAEPLSRVLEPARAGYRGVALVAASAAAWLARADEDPFYIELAEHAHSLGELLTFTEQLNLGHRDGRGKYPSARHGYGQLWIMPPLRKKL